MRTFMLSLVLSLMAFATASAGWDFGGGSADTDGWDFGGGAPAGYEHLDSQTILALYVACDGYDPVCWDNVLNGSAD